MGVAIIGERKYFYIHVLIFGCSLKDIIEKVNLETQECITSHMSCFFNHKIYCQYDLYVE